MKKLLIAGHQASIPEILAIAGDTLGDLLDKQQGHTVTDKDIYRSTADRRHRICPMRLHQMHCLSCRDAAKSGVCHSHKGMSAVHAFVADSADVSLVSFSNSLQLPDMG